MQPLTNIKFLKSQLKKTIEIIGISYNNFTVEIDTDEIQPLSSNSDYNFYYNVLPKLQGKLFNIDEVSEILVMGHNEIPLWIKFVVDKEHKIYRLFISKRFRKLKAINNWHRNNELSPIIIAT